MADRIDINDALWDIRNIVGAIADRMASNPGTADERRGSAAARAVGGISQEDIANVNKLSYSKEDADNLNRFTISLSGLRDSMLSLGGEGNKEKITGGLEIFKTMNESIKDVFSVSEIVNINQKLPLESISSIKEKVNALMGVFEFEGKDVNRMKTAAESIKPAMDGIAALSSLATKGIGAPNLTLGDTLFKIPQIKRTLKNLMKIYDGITPPSKESMESINLVLRNITGYVNVLDSIRNMGSALFGNRGIDTHINRFRKSMFKLVDIFIGQGNKMGIYNILKDNKDLLEEGSTLRGMLGMVGHMFGDSTRASLSESFGDARLVNIFGKTSRRLIDIFLNNPDGLYTILASPRNKKALDDDNIKKIDVIKGSLSSISDMMKTTETMSAGNIQNIKGSGNVIKEIIKTVYSISQYDGERIAYAQGIITNAISAWNEMGKMDIDFATKFASVEVASVKKAMKIASAVFLGISAIGESKAKVNGTIVKKMSMLASISNGISESAGGLEKLGSAKIDGASIGRNINTIKSVMAKMADMGAASAGIKAGAAAVVQFKSLTETINGIDTKGITERKMFGGLLGAFYGKQNARKLRDVANAVTEPGKDGRSLGDKDTPRQIKNAVASIISFKEFLSEVSSMEKDRVFKPTMLISLNIAKRNIKSLKESMDLIFQRKKPTKAALEDNDVQKFAEILKKFSDIDFGNLTRAKSGLGTFHDIIKKVHTLSKSADKKDVENLLAYTIPFEAVARRFKIVGTSLVTGSLALSGALLLAVPAFLSLTVYKGMMKLFGIGMIKDWTLINRGLKGFGKIAIELAVTGGLIGLSCLAFDKISWKSIGKMSAVIGGMSVLMLGLGAVMGFVPAISVGVQALSNVMLVFSAAALIFSGAIVLSSVGFELFATSFEHLGRSLFTVNTLLNTNSAGSIKAISGMLLEVISSVTLASIGSILTVGPFILLASSIRIMAHAIDDMLGSIHKIGMNGGMEKFKMDVSSIGGVFGTLIKSVMDATKEMDVGQNFSISDFLGITNNSSRKMSAVASIVKMTSNFLKMLSGMSFTRSGELKPLLRYDREGNAIFGEPVNIQDVGTKIGGGFGTFVGTVGAALNSVDVGDANNLYSLGDFFGFTNKAQKRVHVVGQLVKMTSTFVKTISGFVGGGKDSIRAIIKTNENGEPVYGEPIDIAAVSQTIANAMSSFVSTMTARLNAINVNASSIPVLNSLGIGIDFSIGGLLGIGSRDKRRMHVIGGLIDMASKFAETLKMMASGDKKIRIIKGTDEKGNPIYDGTDGVDIYGASNTLAESMGTFVSTMIARLNSMDIKYSGAANWLFGFKSDASKKMGVIMKIINGASDFGKMIANFSGEQGGIKVIESYDEKGNPVFSKTPLDVSAAAGRIASSMATFVSTYTTGLAAIETGMKGKTPNPKYLNAAIDGANKFSSVMRKLSGKVGNLVEDSRSLSAGISDFSKSMGDAFSNSTPEGEIWNATAVANVTKFDGVVDTLSKATKKIRGISKGMPNDLSKSATSVKDFLAIFNKKTNDEARAFNNILPIATKNYLSFADTIGKRSDATTVKLKEMTDQMVQLKDAMSQVAEISKSGFNFIISNNGQNPDDVMKNNGISKTPAQKPSFFGSSESQGNGNVAQGKAYTPEEIAKAVYLGVQEGIKQGLQLLNLNAVISMPNGTNINDVNVTMFRG